MASLDNQFSQPNPQCRFASDDDFIAKEFTLPRKILLCPINWGTQWTMEISSNE